MNNKKEENHNNKKVAYLGAGCFWGVEDTLRKLDGVTETTVGFMGGKTQDPTYEQVCNGKTGHTEIVKVEFNPRQISFLDLLKKFWEMHSPVPNPKDNSPKTQYKSVIFYANPAQKEAAEKMKKEVENKLDQEIATEILPAEEFYKADERHQKYYQKLQKGEIQI